MQAIPPPAKRRPRLALATRLGLGFGAMALVLLVGYWAAQRYTSYALERLHDSEVARAPLALAADALAGQVLGYDRAILNQLREDTDETRRASARAAQRVLTAVEDYAARAAKDPSARGLAFAAEIRDHVSLGERLTQSAAERQRVLADYRYALERLSRRISSAFDSDAERGSAAAPSRAFADLELAVGALRDAFNGYLVDETSLNARSIARTQTVFRDTLDAHRSALENWPGAVWLAIVDRDFRAALQLQRRIVASDAAISELRDVFTHSGTSLPARLEHGVSAPARVAIADSASQAADATRSAEVTFRWLAIAVLGVALVVSVITMLSITRPVRRLTEASRALARGAWDTRVPAGGPKELETLAFAFNNMAQHLSSMHQALARHRAELEDRVRARTRKLHHLAHHDTLTNLPNRRYGFTQLRRLVRDATATGRHVGLLALDVDNFKVINDNLGHTLGDQLLCAIAVRLRDTAGSGHFVARLAGDEFVVLMKDCEHVGQAEALAAAIVDAFRRPLHVSDRDVLIGVSVGVAVFPEQADDAQSLSRAADAALFRAKALGRNRFATFAPELLKRSELHFGLEQALRRAIEHGELALVYQPQVDLGSGETTSLEALVRWQRADGTYVPTGELIAVAERSGLIIPLGDWVLETATRTVAAWRSAGFPQARVAVNVSMHQLFDTGFIDRVAAALGRHDLPPSAIELELTESAFQTGAATIEALRRAQDLGIEFALDDFGTGYSSLTSLLKLPVRRVKLDRSLIADVGRNPRSAAVARSIMTVCQSLGLAVTVEGVEELEQLSFISRRTGIAVQGYLIARPLPSQEICAFARGSACASWRDERAPSASDRAPGERPSGERPSGERIIHVVHGSGAGIH